MKRFSLAFGFLISPLLVPVLIQAQAAPGNVDLQGRVLVAIYVTLPESPTFSRPVTGLSLSLAGAGSAIALKTDAAGVASVWARPGSYVLSSTADVVWNGRALRWDVPVSVEPGGREIALTPANATATGPTAPFTVPVVLAQGIQRKDPATATALSFLVPGLGQFYVGSPAKGVALMLADVGGFALTTSGIICNAHDACDSREVCHTSVSTSPNGQPSSFTVCSSEASNRGNQLIYSGIAVSTVAMIVAMVDAHRGAIAYNNQHAAIAALRSARPFAASGVSGSTLVGASVVLP